ncbi:MAG TPA: hypothetical protein VFZ09_31230 [Archangium sp.]|uniref:SitA5 family polymorphic toxin n=1 Tax=Archangium sp. TaxID=1872627 RepID=UPI002E3152EB|nr:hypothetical protein [Archangium sp.]HEX5750740.1 hypothetical protein [Archangium sp.]
MLFLFAACATQAPMTGMNAGRSRTWAEASEEAEARPGPATEPGLEGAVVLDVVVLAPGKVRTRPVPITHAEFRENVERLARGRQLEGGPQAAAAEVLKVQESLRQAREVRPVSDVEAGGTFTAEGGPRDEGGRPRVYAILPEQQWGAVELEPQAEAELRARYERFCIVRGGGDCLGLFEDGPFLRSDDRSTLALALAFGSVLDETYAALGREVSPKVLLTSLLWTASFYLGLWLLPEPVTKGVAAVLTVALVAWLGIDTVWGLMDGWAELVMKARVATTFDELREAGEGFAKVLGTDAARAMIIAVTALAGRTLAEVGSALRSLPGFRLAQVQLAGQGGPTWVVARLERVEAVVVSAEGALAVTVRPEGALAGAMMSRNSAVSASSSGSPTQEVYRHRGGNRQVERNGERWHLSRGVSVNDIPASDPLGDQLQAAAKQVASRWGPEHYSPKVEAAIRRMLQRGLVHRANLLERQARGRWVEEQLRILFPKLDWKPRGVDVAGPPGQKFGYEILSGTDSNFEIHGRRMASSFFRMIFF